MTFEKFIINLLFQWYLIKIKKHLKKQKLKKKKLI